MSSALIISSSGTTNIQLVEQLINCGHFNKVTIISSKQITYDGQNSNILNIQIVDFEKIEEQKDLFGGYSHLFCSLNELNNIDISNNTNEYVIKSAELFKQENVDKNLHVILHIYDNKNGSNTSIMKTVGEEEITLNNMNFSRLSIFRTDIPDYILSKALARVTQLPSLENPNSSGNIIEYFDNEKAYEIAKRADIPGFENDNLSSNIRSSSLSIAHDNDRNYLIVDVQDENVKTEKSQIQLSGPRKRLYKADTIRFALMFLVVFGHLLECFEGSFRRGIYVFVYVFHMPYFIFISGWFARFNQQKIIRHLIFPYIVFQIIYQATDLAVHFTPDLKFSFSTPYWTLWYLFSLICYYLLLPFFEVKTKRNAIIVLGITMITAVVLYFVEYDNFDRFLSISRSISFFPYFLAGHYCSKVFNVNQMIDMPNNQKAKLALIFAPIFVITEGLLIFFDVPDNSIYRVTPENNAEYSLGIPALMFASVASLIILTLLWVPNKRIPLITTSGQNTMPVYIFHVGVILAVRKIKLLHFSEPVNILLSVVIASFTMALLGNRYTGKIFAKIF